MALAEQIKRAWNAFKTPSERLDYNHYGGGPTYSGLSPTRSRLQFSSERSIVASIYTRISIDMASVPIRHFALDEEGRYSHDMNSHLNRCLTLEPNIDQGPRAFRQDLALTLFDKGVAAIVPVDTVGNPSTNPNFDVLSMRVAEIVAWYPKHVRVNVYNEETGLKEEVTLEKRFVAIVENPLYAVMNEQNSTLQRLIKKLHLLDVVDEQSSSGKLDLIIQLPYVIKSKARQEAAEKRRVDIQAQLRDSQYGIAYTDGTEKITQLNRPAENNLLKQVEFLTEMLYGQLGITDAIMNGTADEKAMINYFNRTIEPLLTAFAEAMQRALIGISGRHKTEQVYFFRDPFKLAPIDVIAEISDKFTRNEILTSNEIRGALGFRPSKDPKADKLLNSNMPQPKEETDKPPIEKEDQNGT